MKRVKKDVKGRERTARALTETLEDLEERLGAILDRNPCLNRGRPRVGNPFEGSAFKSIARPLQRLQELALQVWELLGLDFVAYYQETARETDRLRKHRRS